VRARAGTVPRRRVLVAVGHDPLFVAGPGSHLDELLTIAGGENVAHDVGSPYPMVAFESVLERAPEVIVDSADNRPGNRAVRRLDLSAWPSPAAGPGRFVDPWQLLVPGLRSRTWQRSRSSIRALWSAAAEDFDRRPRRGGRLEAFVSAPSRAGRLVWVIAGLGLLLGVVIALAVSFGAAEVPLWHRLLGGAWSETQRAILLALRLPRVLTAAALGGLLGVAGVAFQALLRNPLADPYVLGVSGGASLGGVVALLAGVAALGVPLAVVGAPPVYERIATSGGDGLYPPLDRRDLQLLQRGADLP
jgi:hypothetical protein